MRAWGKFLSNFNHATNDMVEEFIKCSRQRKHLCQSLERLEERGFVARRNGERALTRRGKRFFEQFFLKEKAKEVRGRWDGKWRLVTFDVPMTRNSARYRLYALLVMFGFVPLQRSVWVSPNPLGEEFWKVVVAEGLDEFCKAMVVDIIEGDEELRKRFKL
jgi:DNA-binding transcriptional regulator PaaX